MSLSHRAALPLALALACTLAFSPALGGGWLRYDDDWLVRDNVVFREDAASALATILGDFSHDARLALGAEYLPVRDLVAWTMRGVLDLPVWAMHLVQLALYVAGAVAIRRWLIAALGEGLPAELAAWLFALHPVHVEVASWLASLKDVLLLLFGGLALALWARGGARDKTLAVGLGVLAMLSKGAGVVLPLLFVATDVALGRPLDRLRLALALVIATATAALHAWVGGVVGMYAEPLGGSRLAAASSMVVVTLRYLALSLGLEAPSLVHDVDVYAWASLPVALGSLVLLALAALVVAAWRRGLRWPAFALAVFVVSLAPVSQVLAPLQNRMADRYLLLALAGPLVVVGQGIAAIAPTPRIPRILAGGLVALAAAMTLVRALTFASPTAIFAEATERAPRSSIGPYQLAISLEREGRDDEAAAAYALAIERDGFRTDHGRRAGNNLARLLARHGRVPEARAIYVELRTRYPDDPRVLHNLAVIEEGLGLRADAAAHRAELEDRFPDYEHDRDAEPAPP